MTRLGRGLSLVVRWRKLIEAEHALATPGERARRRAAHAARPTMIASKVIGLRQGMFGRKWELFL
jgi:hypothetical protein